MNLGVIHKEWAEAGVSESGAPTRSGIQERGHCRIPNIKPLLNQRQHQKRLTWTGEKTNWTVAQCLKSSFQMKVHFAFHLEFKVLESGGRVEMPRMQCALKSSVKFPHSVMVLDAMSSASVGPWCLLTMILLC